MFIAKDSLNDLSHQIRFLFFEVGIGLSQKQVEQAVAIAQRELASLQTFSESGINVLAREAMKLLYRQRWQAELRREAFGFDNFWLWLTSTHSASDQLKLLWQWGCKDSFKMEDPWQFNLREMLQYLPAFNSRFSLHWCSVRNHHAPNNDFLQQLNCHFPALLTEWRQKMQHHQLNTEQFIPVPVHPGHWRRIQKQPLASMMDTRELLLISHHQIIKPTLTSNLLIPDQNSSCLLETGETSGDITSIEHLLIQHQHVDNKIYVLRTLSKLHCEGMPTVHLRQNPLSLLKSNQSIIPLSAFFSLSPLSGKPLLCDIIQASRHDPLNYFRLYCQRLLLPQLQLFIKEGMILSLQEDDCLFILENNLPSALVISRVDTSLRLYTNLKARIDRFVSCLIENHINATIDLLHTHYSLPLTLLWQNLLQILQEFLVNHIEKNEGYDALQSTLLNLTHRRQNLLSETLLVANEDMDTNRQWTYTRR